MNADSTLNLRSGNKMPVLGLGTWELTNHTADTVSYALRLGYRMIDTSGDYGTQPGIAEGIAGSGKARNEFYLVTKVEEDEDAYQATKKNLSELRLDYADLMLIHRPPKQGAGEDLWRGLQKARDEGLTRDIGVSNYSEEQIEALIEDSGEVPAVNQIEWSPFGHSMGMLEFCNRHNIIIQAYSPLTRSDRLDEPNLVLLASQYDKTPAQLLIRWNLQLGTVPIVKANQKVHQEENLDVFDFEITPGDMDKLHQMNEEYSSLGSSLIYV